MLKICGEVNGYIMGGQYHRSKCFEHPRTKKDYAWVDTHILVVEQALGKYLPPKACVHHIDEDKLNYANNNLIVCENQAYHYLLHKRINALKACGYANWRKCRFCKQWDSPNNMFINDSYATYYHRNCSNEYKRKKYESK